MEYMGTRYEGAKYNGRMDDSDAIYTFPKYFQSSFRGAVEDGMFQGKGTLKYPKGVNYFGKFEKGKTTEGYFQFTDGLRYEVKDWKYCNGVDERIFVTEDERGLRPAGRSQLTNHDPPPTIPDGMYDCGDGFYKPQERVVESYESQFIRNTDEIEHEWIVTKCRKAWDEPVGAGKVQ